MLEDGRRGITEEVSLVLLIPGKCEEFLTGRPERVLDLSFQGQVRQQDAASRNAESAVLSPNTMDLFRFIALRGFPSPSSVQATAKYWFE